MYKLTFLNNRCNINLPLIRVRLKGSTLTEVLVALVLITLITALFFSIIIKVGNFHKNRKEIIIQQQFFEIVAETKTHGFIDDETIEYRNYYITKNLESFKDITGLYEINLEAFSFDEKAISKHKAIIEIDRRLIE